MSLALLCVQTLVLVVCNTETSLFLQKPQDVATYENKTVVFTCATLHFSVRPYLSIPGVPVFDTVKRTPINGAGENLTISFKGEIVHNNTVVTCTAAGRINNVIVNEISEAKLFIQGSVIMSIYTV